MNEVQAVYVHRGTGNEGMARVLQLIIPGGNAVSYIKMQEESRTCIQYWHRSENALRTFIVARLSTVEGNDVDSGLDLDFAEGQLQAMEDACRHRFPSSYSPSSL